MNSEEYGFILGGKEAKNDKFVEVNDPYTGKLFAKVCVPEKKDIERAIALAQKAFEITRKMTSYERSDALECIAQELKNRKREFAETISGEAGKPIKFALAEVDRAILTFKLSAEEAKRIEGELLPVDLLPSAKNKMEIVKRFPVGI